jgi:hypothetical protein
MQKAKPKSKFKDIFDSWFYPAIAGLRCGGAL